jgi:hypothetical protein
MRAGLVGRPRAEQRNLMRAGLAGLAGRPRAEEKQS